MIEPLDNKLYTKAEVEALLKERPETYFETKEDGELYDYYVFSRPKNDRTKIGDPTYSEELINELFDRDKLGIIFLDNYKLLNKIESEAFDRVWFDRSKVGSDQEDPDMPEEVRDRIFEKLMDIVEKYEIDPEECDDFYHGYWSGILALSRFLSGMFGEDLDILRYGYDGILDT